MGLGGEFLLIYCCSALHPEASQIALQTHMAHVTAISEMDITLPPK